MEQTLDQIRARYALAVVKPLLQGEQKKDFKASYVALCRDIGGQVRQNGLMQALAFCLAKADAAHLAILQQLKDWLTGSGESYLSLALSEPIALFQPNERNICELLSQQSMDDYLLATEEILLLLTHIKLFATAFALKDKNNESDR